LWWRGDAAQSVGVVERGRLAVRTEAGLLDVVPAGGVVGESALLDLGDKLPHRTADLVVLEDDTVVVEYSLDELAEAPGVPQLVLRTLMAQTARNHLVVAAAQRTHALIGAAVDGLLDVLGECARRLNELSGPGQFYAAFRFLYRLREASDAQRRDLVPGEQSDVVARQVLETGRHKMPDAGLAALLEACLRAEAERGSRD
jgi:hypothetical protein